MLGFLHFNFFIFYIIIFLFEGLGSLASFFSNAVSLSLSVHGVALLCVMFRPTCLRSQINPYQNPPYLQLCHITTPRLAPPCLSNCGSKVGRVSEVVMAMGVSSSFQTTPSYFSLFHSCPRSSTFAASSSRSFWASSKPLHRFILTFALINACFFPT